MTDDSDIKQWEQFSRTALHLAGHTDEQIEAMRVKETVKAKQKSEPYIPVVMTNDELRSSREERIREELDRDHPGHDCTEADIKAYVAVTHSDEAIAEHAREWRAQQRAEHDRYAAEYAEDQRRKAEAAKVTAGHSTKLAHEKRATAEETERADRAEGKVRGLERQITGLLKGQRT
jgi:hypothetical protein